MYLPTNSFEDDVEEGNNRPVNKAVQLIDESLFNHLVSRNKHDPLTASPQAKHRAILLSELYLKNQMLYNRKNAGKTL